MRKIELTCHEQQSQSIEFVLKKYRIPYNVELVMSGESKLLRYTTIVPEGISNTVTADLNKIIDRKQIEIYLTIQNIETTVSDYLQNVQTEKKEMKKTKKITEEFHALTEP